MSAARSSVTTATTAVSATPESGERSRAAGDYELLRRLGSGAMGEVWLGRHRVTGTLSAVKLLHESVAGSPRLQRFFERERRVVARLQHAHIVALHALGPGFIATAYIDGSDLTRRMQTPIHPHAAVHYVLQIASALAHAHAQGVVHRDVKPSNILVDRRGNAYLADFGLAAILDDGDAFAEGRRAGTPAYMAPEQAIGRDVGPAADQYALARTLTTLLSDVAPTGEGDPLDHLPPSTPPALTQALRRATSFERAARFPSVDDFALALASAAEALRDAQAPKRLAPELRVRAPFAWCKGAVERRVITPDVSCASYRLDLLALAELLPARAVQAFRETTGYRNIGWTMYGQEARLGRLTSDTALARATDLVVLMHGAFCQRGDWHDVAMEVCRDNAQAIVLIPDLYGSGQSCLVDDDDPAQQTELRGHADMVLRWLELLSVRDMPTVLVGHSLSGTALLPLTDEELGERVSRVAITPSIPEAARPGFRFGASIVKGIVGVGLIRNGIAKLILQTFDTGKVGPEVSKRLYAQFLLSPAWFVKRFVTDYMTATVAPAGSLRRCAILLADDDPVCETPKIRAFLLEHGFPLELIQRLTESGHYPHVKEVGDPVSKGRTIAEIARVIDAMLTSSRDGTPLSTLMASTVLSADSAPSDAQPAAEAG